MKTNSGITENCIKGTAFYTKTDSYVCRQETDILDETQKTRK